MYTEIKAAAQQAALNCDTSILARFFKRLFGPKWVCLVAIHPFGERAIEAKSFRGNDSAGIAKWINARNGTFNLYFGANPIRAAIDRKPRKTDIASIDRFYVDLDPKDNESAQEAILRWSATLADFPYRFSELWVSGNGYTGLIQHSAPYQITGTSDYTLAESCSAALREMLGGKLMGADYVQNVDRVLRIPHTVNIPNERKLQRKRTVTVAGSVTYANTKISEFEFEHLAPVKEHANATVDYDPVPCSVNDPRIGERLRKIIKEGRLQEPKSADDTRSAWEYDAACELQRAGMSNGESLYLLTDNAHAISEKSSERSDPLAYMRQVIANAKRDVGVVDAMSDFDAPLDPEWMDGYDIKSSTPAGNRHPFKGFTLVELAAMAPPEYLVDGIMYVGGTSMVYGKQKAGKTYFVGTMGFCVATGTAFAGLPVKQGGVLHIVAEGNAALFGQRVEAWVRHEANGSKSAELRIRAELNKHWRMVSSAVHIAEPAQAELLLQQNPGPWKMIIVDTVFRNASGDINQQQDAQLFIDGADYLARTTGAAVVLVHHVGKDSAKGAFGSTVLAADVDLSAMVRLDGNKRTFKVVEARNAFDGRPIAFDLIQVELGTDANGKRQSSAAIRFHDRSEPDEPVSLEEDILRFIWDEKPKTQTVIASNFKMNKQRISEKIKELREDGFITNDGLQLTPVGLEYIREPDDGFG